jgi:hypothetical protein
VIAILTAIALTLMALRYRFDSRNRCIMCGGRYKYRSDYNRWYCHCRMRPW